MEYANQAQIGRAVDNFRGIGGGAAIPVPTLASRLERAARDMAAQCSRIEGFLDRIHGGSRPENPNTQDKIAGTAPLAQSVEAVEHGIKRMCELASRLEQIA